MIKSISGSRRVTTFRVKQKPGKLLSPVWSLKSLQFNDAFFSDQSWQAQLVRFAGNPDKPLMLMFKAQDHPLLNHLPGTGKQSKVLLITPVSIPKDKLPEPKEKQERSC